MKTLKLIIVGLLIGSAITVMEGCKKDVVETDESSTPNLSTKGGIAFKVKNSAGDAVSGAKIGLAVSQADLATNTYLASKITDANGMADLGKFSGGNYYYEVDVTLGSTPYHGDGSVQLRNGEDIVQELTTE